MNPTRATGFSTSTHRLRTSLRRWTGVVLLIVAAPMACAWAPSLAQAQQIPVPAAQAPARVVRHAPAKGLVARKTESAPAWSELSASQQQVLAPLSATWGTLSEAHKRKWIALAENYPRLAPAEQAKLHSRMAEWAAMTPQQRTQARLNFGEASKRKLSAEDKKAMWAAYQALPAEEKKRLAAKAKAAKPTPPATAVATQPIPRQKLARVPKSKKANEKLPRIAVAPNEIDNFRLLPTQPSTVPNQP